MSSEPDQEDREPDVRFTYANERTFLAWNRTALALIATGVAATQLLPNLHIDGGRRILGLPLIALGALVAIYHRAVEQASRFILVTSDAQMQRVMQITGLNKVMPIFTTREEALASFEA